MIKKAYIVYFIFSLSLVYIIAPRALEKTLLLNEWLALTGVALLVWNRFRIKRSEIVACFLLLLVVCAIHAIVSLFRMDHIYYYLRNLVIFYSMFTFFIGFYLYHYLRSFMVKAKAFLMVYVPFFLLFPNESFFDRFGMSALFPALFQAQINRRFTHYLLVPLNIMYAISYQSSTAFIIALFLLLVFISPGYRFFKGIIVAGVAVFILFFIYIHPYIAVIYTFPEQANTLIGTVKRAHPLLAMDPNNTWRLIIWDQLIVSHFPMNLLGIGFGTPALRYFPIEDLTKISTLPYVVGGHNSFIYLFCRLGIAFVILIVWIYHQVFKEYFAHRKAYRESGDHLIFFSFFSVSIIACFNPVLETPIFAGSYWLLLGFVCRAIYRRQLILT